MKNTIRIEGGSYTSLNSAMKHVSRGKAVIINRGDEDILVFNKDIRHFNVPPQTGDLVTGNFEWMVRDSGGSSLMKAYEGISGGTRVLQASHGSGHN